MWKAVGSVHFQMDAREAYQAIVSAGAAGPVVDLSANGVRFTCRPQPGRAPADLYCILLEASLTMEPLPAVHYGLIRAPAPGDSGGVQSLHSDLVVARLIIRQLRAGRSEGVLEIVPYLELPDGNAHCLANLVIQHLSGSAFHELCEPLMRGLVAEVNRGLANAEAWHAQQDIAATLGPSGIWLLEEAMPLDTAAPRVITAPCGGRPRAWEDDWIHQQVDLLGRDRMEVFADWLALMPVERRKRLKDPYESFKYALHSRRKKSSE